MKITNLTIYQKLKIKIRGILKVVAHLVLEISNVLRPKKSSGKIVKILHLQPK